MVDKKKAVVARKHAALENICRRFLVGLSPTCPITRAVTVLRSHSFPVKSVPLENVVFVPESRNLATKAA